MKIQLKTDELVTLKAYRMPFANREIVSGIIQELLASNIMRPSSSKYASPVVLIEKKNGEHRWCVDYRWLNKIRGRM